MTHTVHPYAHRLGILRDWKSRWFVVGAEYKQLLKSDILIREYLVKRLKGLYVASIEIERSGVKLKVFVKTARPGMLIGRQGEGSVRLKNDLEKFMKKNAITTKGLSIEIEEVRSPESNASIVAQMIAEGLERRLPFRRVLKQMIEKVMANRNLEGVRIMLSGRLGGAEMGRKEQLKKGKLPLQTFRADVDFAKHTARLPYGAIGIKVWIYKGDIFEKK